ncbi:MAG TPA: helix-turn-helix transcriptional regulator [Candidatus Dormibacteraeota bacterium]|nr:helix-turn-helix transcriptional regulator [Candidatus Dormibacteraeota bacterium]
MAGLRGEFGRAVRAVRVDRGWTQEQLAEAAALDRTYISGLERGSRNPALSTIERLATALEVKVSTLIVTAEGATN